MTFVSSFKTHPACTPTHPLTHPRAMASLAEVNYAAACEPGTTQLGSALGSIIKLTIKNARGLRNKEQFGMKSDPYVSLSQFSGFCMWGETTQGLDKKKCSGKWIDSNLDPDFNQEFYFVASKDTTRCKLMVMDHNAGIIADELMASTQLDLSGAQGAGQQKLFPQGTLDYEYVRSPILTAFNEPGQSGDSWDDISRHQTKMSRLVLINVISVGNVKKGKATHVKVGGFKNDRLLPVTVAGGTKSGEKGQASETDSIKSDDDGTVTFNRPYLFLAGGDLHNFTLTVSQKGMLGYSSVGDITVGITSRAGKLQKSTDGDATVNIEFAYVDLDVGAVALVNSEARAAREAELAAIAEKERQEAEAERLAAEAAAAALLAAQQAEYEAEQARLKAEKDASAAAEAEAAAARAAAAREEAAKKQAEEDKLWQTKVKKMVAACGVAAAAAWAATCMYGSWGVDRANETLDQIQARATAYLDGNPAAAAKVDTAMATANLALEKGNEAAKKGIAAASKGIDKLAGKMKKFW